MKLRDLRAKTLGAGALSAGVLALLLGTSGMAKAQEAREEARPQQQEEPKQDEGKPRKDEPAREAKPARNEKQDDKEMKAGKEQERAQENQGRDREARSAAQHAQQHGQRIPDDKFRSHFGRVHTFRVQRTVIVEGQSRFQYSGFWFALANPWPGDWAYSDDCYIDFIDGEYVLVDLLHPGVQIAVIVVG